MISGVVFCVCGGGGGVNWGCDCLAGREVGVEVQWWNADFSNTRLFETPDSLNQKSFPFDLLQSNTVILPPIFRMLDFSKLPIFRTNCFFLSKIYIRFLEL